MAYADQRPVVKSDQNKKKRNYKSQMRVPQKQKQKQQLTNQSRKKMINNSVL